MPISDHDIDLDNTVKFEIFKRLRSKLHFCAALALKNDIDLTDELNKIFGEESPLRQIPKHKIAILPAEVINQFSLNPFQTQVLEAIYKSDEPITINEMYVLFRDKEYTSRSPSSITKTVAFLKGMSFIEQANNADGIVGYTRAKVKNDGTVIT
jgi:hypothetical protein